MIGSLKTGVATLLDSITLAESFTTSGVRGRTISETLTLAEAFGSTHTFQPALADSLTLAESFAAAGSRTLTEGLTICARPA